MKHPTPSDAMIEAAWETLRSAMIPTPRFHDKNCWKQATKDVLQAALAQQQPSGEVVGEAIWVKFTESSNGIHIKKWAKQPFEGATAFYADTTAWNANMDEAPKHTEIDVWHPENGIFLGQHTCLAGLFSDARIEEMYERGELSEADNEPEHEDCWWVYLPDGIDRCEGDQIPTHWRLRPQPPEQG